MKKLSVFLLTFGGLVSTCLGSVRWEATKIEQTAPLLAESVVASFGFTNTGDTPVTFKEIKSSCGCTTAALEKMTYAPGESGVIKATLNTGNRQGMQIKKISVMIEGEAAPTELTMQTDIPTLLDVKPVFVFWPKGKAPEPKIITLRVGIGEPVHILGINSNQPTINASLETIEDGKCYQITLFPLSTDDIKQANITIVTDYPKDNPKTFYVLAQIK